MTPFDTATATATEDNVVTTHTDVFDTPTLSLPPATPDIHEGTITSVEVKTFESGKSAIFVNLVSKNTGKDEVHKIWPPQEYFDNTNWKGGQFDVTVLGDVPDPGKSQSPRVRFAKTIASTEGAATTEINGREADLQLLIKLAKNDGRLTDGFTTPTDAESYIGNVNSLVAGLEVLFTRTPDKSDDPQYSGRLRVGRILGKDVLNDPKFDKRYPEYSSLTGKGYRRAWSF